MLQDYYQKEAVKAIKPESCYGTTVWQSPSNIAIVKYWGKHGNQLPNNPSVSFTLSAARTETAIRWEPKKEKGIQIEFYFEGQPQPQFAEKIRKFLSQQLDILPFLNDIHLDIESHNSFPHSSGIASSASSMSALVMCLLDIERHFRETELSHHEKLQKASWLSRMASGSAARSVFPYISLWGTTSAHAEGHDEYAVVIDEIHPIFKSYRDSILIINAGTKSVSSRAGHALMDVNPFANTRYDQAHKHTEQLLKALKTADLDVFMQIAEAEALQLHALMMTSIPSFILLKPATLAAIEKVRAFRHETGIPLCFTLDAGPNLHLLYPEANHKTVQDFIQSDLATYCENNYWINDAVGTGPSEIFQK